jgi:hypothetical protein
MVIIVIIIQCLVWHGSLTRRTAQRKRKRKRDDGRGGLEAACWTAGLVGRPRLFRLGNLCLLAAIHTSQDVGSTNMHLQREKVTNVCSAKGLAYDYKLRITNVFFE